MPLIYFILIITGIFYVIVRYWFIIIPLVIILSIKDFIDNERMKQQMAVPYIEQYGEPLESPKPFFTSKAMVEAKAKYDAHQEKIRYENARCNFYCWVNGREAKKFMDDPTSSPMMASHTESEHFNFLTRIDPNEFNIFDTTNEVVISWKKK